MGSRYFHCLFVIRGLWSKPRYGWIIEGAIIHTQFYYRYFFTERDCDKDPGFRKFAPPGFHAEEYHQWGGEPPIESFRRNFLIITHGDCIGSVMGIMPVRGSQKRKQVNRSDVKQWTIWWVVGLLSCYINYVSFGFFLRFCRYVCDGNYSLKNAQGSGRGRSWKPRGRVRFALRGRLRKEDLTLYFWRAFRSMKNTDLGTYPFCFGVLRKPRGSFAEAPRKEHMPKQQSSRKQKFRKRGRGSSRKGHMWNVRRGSWRCGRGSIAEAVAEAVNNFLSTRKGKKPKLMCSVYYIAILIYKYIRIYDTLVFLFC